MKNGISMLRNDTFLTGLIVGLVIPAMVFVILHELGVILEGKEIMVRNFSFKFKAVISIFSNILPFIIYSKTKKGHAMQGILTITFIYAFAVMLFLYF
ncbi:MAG: hypothetical protein HKN92_01155 [Chitinophagales bacterium]|nr:hypothetical protein [Chitinophagales bacterium]